MRYISELREGGRIQDVYLCKYKQSAVTKNGKNYESLSDFLQELIGKPVCAHVVHDEYNGNKREAIAWFNPTDYPEVKHVMKKKPDVNPDGYASAAQQTTYANLQAAQAAAEQEFASMPLDDDLPF